MSRSNHIPQRESFEKELLQRIITYLEAHLSMQITVSLTASEFNLSKTALQRLFKTHLQQTFQQYLENLRMSRAIQLIYEGRGIKEIMFEVGYRHRSSFNKAFLKKFKHPPIYFRKRR